MRLSRRPTTAASSQGAGARARKAPGAMGARRHTAFTQPPCPSSMCSAPLSPSASSIAFFRPGDNLERAQRHTRQYRLLPHPRLAVAQQRLEQRVEFGLLLPAAATASSSSLSSPALPPPPPPCSPAPAHSHPHSVVPRAPPRAAPLRRATRGSSSPAQPGLRTCGARARTRWPRRPRLYGTASPRTAQEER